MNITKSFLIKQIDRSLLRINDIIGLWDYPRYRPNIINDFKN